MTLPATHQRHRDWFSGVHVGLFMGFGTAIGAHLISGHQPEIIGAGIIALVLCTLAIYLTIRFHTGLRRSA